MYWESRTIRFEDQLNLEFESQRIAGAAEDFKEALPRSWKSAPQNSRANDGGAARTQHCLVYPGATGVANAARLSGGASQETWSFDIVHPDGNIGAILRRAPPGYGACADAGGRTRCGGYADAVGP